MPIYEIRGLQTLDVQWWIRADTAEQAQAYILEWHPQPQNVVGPYDEDIDDVKPAADDYSGPFEVADA